MCAIYIKPQTKRPVKIKRKKKTTRPDVSALGINAGESFFNVNQF